MKDEGNEMQEMMPSDFHVETKKKSGFLKGLLVGVLLAVILGLLVGFFAVRLFLGHFTRSSGAAGTVGEVTGTAEGKPNPEHLEYDRITAKIKLMQQVIRNNYLFDEDPRAVEEGIYSGMMKGLGDPYTVYYTAEEFAKINEETSGTYSGIGALLSQDPKTGICTVINVFKGSPAEEAGLQAKDILFSVDGKEITGEDLDYFVSTYIRGESGSSVKLVVLRGETREELTLDITRRSIDVPTVEYEMKEGGVGYVCILQFDLVTPDQFEQAIEELTKQGMKALVLDLRNNPGGVLQSAVKMLDYMLPDGLLVYTAGRSGVGDKYYSSDGHEVKLPTALLINGNSASCSEIFAGAYRDFHAATLVGTKSFGKGIVQFVLPLGDGSAVKLTTQHYYTPSGFDLHGKGIEPDVEVESEAGDTQNGAHDAQLKKALEILKSE